MFVFALEQGGAQYPWDSAAIVASFVVAGICWAAFGVWETCLTKSIDGVSMWPIFPTRLLQRRVVSAALL